MIEEQKNKRQNTLYGVYWEGALATYSDSTSLGLGNNSPHSRTFERTKLELFFSFETEYWEKNLLFFCDL